MPLRSPPAGDLSACLRPSDAGCEWLGFVARATKLCSVPAPETTFADDQVDAFIQHLTNERGASPYTIRNYSQALAEFGIWHERERRHPPAWDKLLRDDFRYYL